MNQLVQTGALDAAGPARSNGATGSLRFSWNENCFDRYQASIEACTPEQQQILKSIRDRKVNSESDAAYGYRRNGEADYVVQRCWDLVRLLQRLKFSKTDAPADKRTLNGDDVTQIQITECVVVQGAFKLPTSVDRVV